MSEAIPDTTPQLDAARGLLESRLDAIRQALTAYTEHERAQEAAKDAETAAVKAYRAALATGWSEQELKKIGLDAPGKVQRVRRRRSTAQHPDQPADPAPGATTGSEYQ